MEGPEGASVNAEIQSSSLSSHYHNNQLLPSSLPSSLLLEAHTSITSKHEDEIGLLYGDQSTKDVENGMDNDYRSSSTDPVKVCSSCLVDQGAATHCSVSVLPIIVLKLMPFDS